MAKINANDHEITVINMSDEDYISLRDILFRKI